MANQLDPYVVTLTDGSSFVIGATCALQAKGLAGYISTLPIVSVALHPHAIDTHHYFSHHHSAALHRWSSMGSSQ